MKNAIFRLSVTLLAGASLLLMPADAEAQFFKKLAKGLEKVNKGLEKVESVIKGEAVTDSGDNDAEKPDAQLPESLAQDETVGEQSTAEVSEEVVLPEYNRPHYTDDTRFLLLDREVYGDNFSHEVSLTSVSEGIFAIKDMRGQWSFFDVNTGQCIHRSAGSQANRRRPAFSGGAAVVKTPNGHRILYTDGRIKELDKTFSTVEDFVDGVSMVLTFDSGYVPSTYYIDINGEKIYPELEQRGRKMGDRVGTYEVRPLRDGLRAVRKDGKWGFIDAAGTMKIPPKFNYVSDFSEGHAWVTVTVGTDYKIGMIDRSGNFTIEPRYRGYNQEIQPAFGAVSCGIARVIDNNNLSYVDTHGNILKEFGTLHGTSFTGGYACIIKEPYSMIYYLVDTDFSVVGSIDISGDIDIAKFSECGLAVVGTYGSRAISPDYNVRLAMPDDNHLRMRDFSADGYAYAETKFGDGFVRGFINTDGEYTVVISTDAADNHEWRDEHNSPWINDPIKQRPPLDPAPPEDLGPKTAPSPKYVVTTRALPAEGGTVSPGGSYGYGHEVKVVPTAAEGWRFSGFDAPRRSLTPYDGTFRVYEDMVVTANFIEKDDVKTPVGGVWEGEYPFAYTTPEGVSISERVPLYLEMSGSKNISTPMGDKYGILTIVFDPDKVYRTGQKKNTAGGQQSNLMFIPMVVEGVIERDGANYLLIDGGEFKMGNILIEPGQGDGGLNALVVDLFLKLFGNDLSIGQGTYMLRFDVDGDNVKLGSMDRFHTTYGWLAGGDERFMQFQTSGIMWGFDCGLPADMFDGSILTPARKRDDIMWYVPKSWTFNDDAAYIEMKEKFDKAYKEFIGDYFGFWK